uniref:EF-hand and coiled-coil domain containing 1 n=1 Tax=Hucho hucho TaxID=62062 RepID=A0A4W5R500_9TELE
MNKILDKVDNCDLYGRPARRTQWIASTLAYHYGLDRGVENEIIVLATGLDQYLQEIFHHMDCTGDGKIPMEDFNILCEILGLNKDSESEECVGVLDNLPSEFTFRQFHAKLCGYFSTKAGSQYENGRLLVGKDSEHIETQIRLRIPLRRRGSSPNSDRHLPAEERITKLQDENANLRELVEDMRAALQSSDARSLALQVRVSTRASVLEQELRSSREAVSALEGCNRALQAEQGDMRRKVEDARQALVSGMGKVKELEAEASRVPVLQRHIQQLEQGILYYRLTRLYLQEKSFRVTLHVIPIL